MDYLNIISAKYNQEDGVNCSVQLVMDGYEMSVPLDPANRHYVEILRQVEEGTLTIEPADTPE